MFKVNIVAVGKIKDKFYLDAVNEYKKRLSRFCEFNIIECKEENLEVVPSKVALKKESDEILPCLRGKVVALCVEGKGCSSEKFAEKLKKAKDEVGEITFVIGSSCGLSDCVKNRADELLSFSQMTFPHMLFRVMLTEQLYRAFMINGGGKYHK